jgi:hypothetical protein
MKVFFRLFLAALAAVVLTGGNFARTSSANPRPVPAAPQEQGSLYCASDDMHRNLCPADTRGGVQLLRQRSEAACVFNQAWGYDDRGIWVDRGCRADFQIGAARWSGWGQTFTIYCSSEDMERNFCPTDTHHGVRLARQRSETDCLFGRTWGYTPRGIWVDHGCRGDFEIGNAGWTAGGDSQSVYCASPELGRHYCEADTSRGVRLIRQRSDTDCVYGRTWGYDERGIWVEHGCQGDFQIASGDGDGDADDATATPDVQSIYCASDDLGRHRCWANTRNGVRLLRQISETPCDYNRTWGYDERGIWVDRGCRADFRVGAGAQTRVETSVAATLYCASDDMGWHACHADTRGGVRLLQQRSEAQCIYNQTWGYDDRNIWVDRGCRADFQTGGTASAVPPAAVTTTTPAGSFYCASDDMKWHACPVDARNGVRLLQQRSEAQCIYNQTWGYDDRNIWVDRGCRADFQMGGNEPAPHGQTTTLHCASDGKGLHNCPADTTGGVRLVNQRSKKPCAQWDTWGYDARGVWVGNGCKADFEIGGGNDSAVTSVYCASDDQRRHACAANTRQGVELLRQRSEAECFFGRTWGYDDHGVWVDRGCGADFQLHSDWKSGGHTSSVSCASNDMLRHACSADTRRGVRLTRQHSEAKCIFGQSWSYDQQGIWVDRGCRADFELWRPH